MLYPFFSKSAARARGLRAGLLLSFAFLMCFSSPAASSAAPAKVSRPILRALDTCGLTSQIFKTFGVDDPLAPAASLCINGSIALTDPTYNRTLASSTGTGIGTGVVGNCSLSGTATAAHYDAYAFNITGCVAFPTVVTAQLCGPAGCLPPGALDTVLTMYRNVAAGDPLTANGGLPAVFNPASPCTNARASNDDSGTTPTSTGGSTCNQLNTADCLPQCGTSTALSEFKRTVGNGRFTLVIAGFGNTTAGAYNLYVNVPAAGCVVALAPTAANVAVAGRVMTPDGSGLRNATVLLSDSAGNTRSAQTGSFGYYRFDDVTAGETYAVNVSSKRFQFTPRTVSVTDELTDLDFIPESPGALQAR